MSNVLTGRWSMFQQTATYSLIIRYGKIRSRTRSLLVFDLTHEGDVLFGSGRLLDMCLDSGRAPLKVTFPLPFVRAQPTPELSANIYAVNGGYRFVQPKRWSVLGARLNDPATDPLPTHAKDPNIWDQDEDGNPGVTVNVSGLVNGSVYLTQRSWSELNGFQTSADTISGSIRFGQEQVILGATNPLLKMSPRATPDPENSFFIMKRIAADADDFTVRDTLHKQWVA